MWQPFFDALAPPTTGIEFSPLKIVSTSAREFWSPTLIKTRARLHQARRPARRRRDNVFWPGDAGQAGQFLHGYQSTWLPAALLPRRRAALADALFACTRHWGVSLHFNKGLAGAPAEALAAARDTAINPAALDAFALAIIGAEEQPAYPGVAGHEPRRQGRAGDAQAIARAMAALRKLVPEPAPTSRRATTSRPTGSAPSGAATTRACPR